MLFHVATVKSSSVSESVSGQLLEAEMVAKGRGREAEVVAKGRGRDRAKRPVRRSRSPRVLRAVPMEALHSVVCVSNEAAK